MALAPTVAFAPCSSYSSEAILRGVSAALEHLGGIDSFVHAGQRVLVKPNLLTDAPPEQGKTTHPEVVRAVLRLVREAGGTPFVADCPASALKLESVWNRTGIADMCREEHVELVSLEEGGSRLVTTDAVSFTVAQRVIDADVVVSVPKLKTHVLTGLTCAVKNLYGCIPGMQKMNLHKQYFAQPQFAALLAALYAEIRPALTIVDGIVCMEGNGPTSGELVQMGFVAAANDAVALDAVVCDEIGLPRKAVPYLAALVKNEEGETRRSHIRVEGLPAGQLGTRKFRPPNTLKARLVPGWLANLLGKLLWIRPGFTDACVSCGRCVEMCPVSALEILHEGQKPALDRKTCIACCCCHEICPQHAVEMQMSRLFRYASSQDQCLKPPAEPRT